MANLWDDLSPEERRAVAKQGMVGSEQSNGNLSRMMEQLSQNPKLVERLAAEAGVVESDTHLDDTQPDADQDQDNEGDIERTVNEAIDDPNVQDTGELTQDIPPPQRGENINDYVARLMAETENSRQGYETINDDLDNSTTVVRANDEDYQDTQRMATPNTFTPDEVKMNAAKATARFKARKANTR